MALDRAAAVVGTAAVPAPEAHYIALAPDGERLRGALADARGQLRTWLIDCDP